MPCGRSASPSNAARILATSFRCSSAALCGLSWLATILYFASNCWRSTSCASWLVMGVVGPWTGVNSTAPPASQRAHECVADAPRRRDSQRWPDGCNCAKTAQRGDPEIAEIMADTDDRDARAAQHLLGRRRPRACAAGG